jgi:hypothetical protein
MKIETIEILLVLAIVSVQIYLFVQTFRKINFYKNIIPDDFNLKVTKLLVPTGDLALISPRELLEKSHLFKDNFDNHKAFAPNENSTIDSPTLYTDAINVHNTQEQAEINIIEVDGSTNSTFREILIAINNYLISNRGAASDFNLLKDIVERNVDSVEEEINQSIGIPLYLGLMGTMVGIVIGLFNMPDLAVAVDTKEKDILLNEGIGLLIGGVKIAMIASFIGLLCTIINSGFTFKGSKSYNEKRKNKLYTFIQIELLPIINQGLGSTLQSLQRNLLKFNSEFSENLKGLSGIFDSSRNAIKEQKDLLDALDKAKVSDMTRYNVAVLKQLDVSVNQFEKFNSYLTNVNVLVDNSQKIVGKTNELMARTENFKSIADNLESKLNQSQMLMEFLSKHFNKLEEHKEFTSNAVADVGYSISETFKELKEHIQNSTESVKQFTIDETEALKDALSASKTNLNNLEHLASLKTDVSQFKNSASSQSERLNQTLAEINRNLSKSNAYIELIEKRSLVNRAKSLTQSVRRFLVSKK